METRHPRKTLAVLSAIIISVAVFVVGVGFYLSPQNKLEKTDAIVVISGGQTTTRAKTGIELYEKGYAPRLIFSGAALDDGPSNAAAMRRQALSAGVSDNAIEVDEDSKNTYQNAENTKRIMDEEKIKKIILVTSPYHQRRASMTFKKILGGDHSVINYSSFDNRWSKSGWWATPFGLRITIAELFKVIYIKATGNYR